MPVTASSVTWIKIDIITGQNMAFFEPMFYFPQSVGIISLIERHNHIRHWLQNQQYEFNVEQISAVETIVNHLPKVGSP
jgi:hypothetical protein